MWLTRFAISRPVITAMVFIGLAIFGIIAYTQLGRSANPPNTTFPVVIVEAGYPGTSPQEMEKLVVKPIEDQLTGIDNLDQISATSQEGSAVVVIQFKIGTNLDLAAIDVQRRVDTARVFMPTDLIPPTVFKNGASDPLMELAVSSNSLSPTQLSDVVDNQLKPLLSQMPNVQTVDVYGEQTREFHVEPIPGRLLALNATLSDVFNAVAANNLNLPGGLLQQATQEASVSVYADVNSANDLAAIPLPIPGHSSKVLRVGDVGYTYDSYADQRTISRYNGTPRVYVQLGRNINADEIKTTAAVRSGLKTLEAQFPKLQFHEIVAPADFTSKSLMGVGQSLIEGILLTAIVMLLFLHAWRNAAVVLIAIPSSILSTFIVMLVLGFHLDIISLMGLSLIIGILVDDSIVVLENITRHRDLGQDPINAAITGRTEIGGAAIAITMVDVVVFLPIAFLPGIVGSFLKEYALVVVVATLMSLLVSFTLTPLLAARWSVKERAKGLPRWMEWFRNPLHDVLALAAGIGLSFIPIELLRVAGIFLIALVVLNVFVQRYDRIMGWYHTKALPFGLAHGGFVVYVCVLLLVNSILLLAGGSVSAGFDIFVLAVLAAGILLNAIFKWWKLHRGAVLATFAFPIALALILPFFGQIAFDFVPDIQSGQISMTVTYPPGSPIRQTSRYVDRLSSAILKIDGIKSVSSTVGTKPLGYGQAIGGNYAQLDAATFDDHIKDTNKIMAQIRTLTYLLPGAQFQVANGNGGGGASIFYSVSGPPAQMEAAAQKIASFLRDEPGTVNVQIGSELAAPRLNVRIDSGKAAILGVSPGDAATAARIAVDGAVATRVRTGNGLVDVRVAFPQADRNTVDELKSIRVRSSDGTLVPLSDLASFSWTKAPTAIDRLDRARAINVFGDHLPEYSLGSVTDPLKAALKQPGFVPAGVRVIGQGDTEFLDQTITAMAIALAASFMLVYMLMVILYGSFVEPLIVMFSVPLAVIGALFALAIMHVLDPTGGQSLNLLSMLGIVMLFGLVSKNGILLVDYSNTLVKRGMRVREAVLQASATRFRPIVMTTSAMVFGMLPLAVGLSAGAEWRQAMGTVIIGGLLSSLILTLFLVPMIYNTWMGYFERRADARAVREELRGAVQVA